MESDNESNIHLSDSESEEERPGKKQRQEQASEDDEPIRLKLDENASEPSDEESADEDGAEDEVTGAQEPAAQIRTLSNLAAQQILTPADFAKLTELRTTLAEQEAQAGGNAAKRKLKDLKSRKQAAGANEDDKLLTESEIVGWQKRSKDDYEARMESIAKGREGREKFGSKKGKRKEEKHLSKTNFEKKKSKNFMMTLHSSSVRSKKYASLRDKQSTLR